MHHPDTKALVAELIAEGELSIVAIAEKTGVARRTIYEWMDEAMFRAAVDSHAAKVRMELGPALVHRLLGVIRSGDDKAACFAIGHAIKVVGYDQPKQETVPTDSASHLCYLPEKSDTWAELDKAATTEDTGDGDEQ